MPYGIARGLTLLIVLLGLVSGRSHAQVAITLNSDTPTSSSQDTVEIKVVADLSGRSLGAINARVSWDPAKLRFVSIADGGYGQLTTNTRQASSGQVGFAAFQAGGQSGEFPLARLRFQPLQGVTGAATVDIAIEELLAARSFEDLLPQTTTVPASLLLGGIGPADLITVAFKGPAEVGVGDQFAVEAIITVPQGVPLGALAAVLQWDPALLRYQSIAPGSYGEFTSSDRSAAAGQVRFAAFDAPGKDGTLSLGSVRFEAQGAAGDAAGLNLVVDELLAANTFEDLLPRLQVGSYRVDFIQEGVGLSGDFDGNKVVDFADFFLFADQFQLTASSTNWDPLYDLAPDGRIDFADFFVFADVFGRTAP